MSTTRAEWLRSASPQLIADVTLYPTTEGGKNLTAHLGWGCPCCCTKSSPASGWDGWPLLDGPLAPGDRRRRFSTLERRVIVDIETPWIVEMGA